VAAGLEQSYPERFHGLASFETGNADDLRVKLERILALTAAEHEELARAARAAVVAKWSWASVAARLLEPF